MSCWIVKKLILTVCHQGKVVLSDIVLECSNWKLCWCIETELEIDSHNVNKYAGKKTNE